MMTSTPRTSGLARSDCCPVHRVNLKAFTVIPNTTRTLRSEKSGSEREEDHSRASDFKVP